MTILPADLHFQRSFGWGVLLLSDADTGDIPVTTEPGPVVATDTAVAICVRDASDVEVDGMADAEEVPQVVVNVSVTAGPSPHSPLAFDGVVAVPSGTLLLGDAEHEQALPVGPGTYRVQVWLDDRDHAENVRIALTPTDG